eukprot:NP_001024602.1 Uncharacterized protein CELE_F23D12.8 [Caenorhabditis elegans]
MEQIFTQDHRKVRMYQLLRKACEKSKQKKAMRKKKTYWDKHPDLKLLKSFGTRRLTSFMFFSYMFLFASAEYTNILQFGYSIIIAQMGALSCFVCLFVPVLMVILNIAPTEYFLIAFTIYIFGVTATVTFVLAKATDLVWQGFYMLVDLCTDDGIIKKLVTTVEMENSEEEKKNQRPKGVWYL